MKLMYRPGMANLVHFGGQIKFKINLGARLLHMFSFSYLEFHTGYQSGLLIPTLEEGLVQFPIILLHM
jgi:hypothetical protein